MREPQYVRAEYDEARNSYVSDGASWIDGGPSLEYSFGCVIRTGKSRPVEGHLTKCWYADGERSRATFAFGKFRTVAEFEAAVRSIRAEAREVAANENLDELLAVTDIIKNMAIKRRLAEAYLEDMEGLFEVGPEDAYTLRDFDPTEERLHDHVECEDECWFMKPVPAADENGQVLGWALLAVYVPELPSTATLDEMRGAERAAILRLDTFRERRDVLMAQRGFWTFMETDRLDNPLYAYMDDTDVLELAAIPVARDEEKSESLWQDCNQQTLCELLDGSFTYTMPRAAWQPRAKAPIDDYFEANPHPVWLEDQFRAVMDEVIGLKPESKDDDPWTDFDLT